MDVDQEPLTARLRQDEMLLRTALDAARMNAFEWDVATDRVVRVGEMRRFLGISEEEAGSTGAAYFALLHPQDREAAQRAIAALRPEAPELVQEYRIVAGGRTRWVRESARGEFDAGGRLVRLRGVAFDVTDRREAEGRLTLIARVSESIGTTEDAAELLYEVSRSLGEHLHARRCLFTEIDLEHDRGIVRRDYCRGVPSVAGVYRVSDYARTTREEMEAGRTVVNCDSKSDPRTADHYEQTYAPQGERSYLAVPLLRDGRWVAELWISDDAPRQWQPQDVALAESIAERAWTAVEKLRVHAALRASEARMQFVGDRANVGYWYWDLGTGELTWSPVCRRLFGVTQEEPMSYERFLLALHPDDRDRTDATVRGVIESGGASPDYDIEYRTVWPDGTVHWLQAKGSAAFEDGSAVRMAGIALDISRRKTLELEREELLEQERRLRAAADEASLAKDHFLALLSHELRTPMTTILGWASFIRSGLADAETAQKGIASIEQASRMQSRLIEDLLDVSGVVTGKLTLTRQIIDVRDVVRSAIEVTQPAANDAAIAVRADLGETPALVDGDAARLRQVVWNLLSNAVKFTSRGGEVRVTVRRIGNEIEIAVSDDGLGIAPEFLPHVFERFRQAENGPTRRFGGLGLGLSIAQHLTELHGGTIEASSAGAGQGAQFRVTLKAAQRG